MTTALGVCNVRGGRKGVSGAARNNRTMPKASNRGIG